MVTEKKLYRANDTLLGGVCTGIAEYIGIDPIIAQILTVVLSIASAGAVIILYIVLWIIIPKRPDPHAPVDVQPQEVHSDTYGQVRYSAAQTEGGYPMGNETKNDPFAGSAHTPPSPPYAQPQTVHPQTPPVPPVRQAAPPSSETERGSVNAALGFGFILLFIGICALLGVFVVGVSWWQFWPLLPIIAGIADMVIPGRKGHRFSHFISGFMMFTFGVAALPFSLGFVSLGSLGHIFTNLWPVLIIMCGLFIIGEALGAPAINLLGALCFVAFCAIGIIWFSSPGPTDLITLSLPTGQTYTYDLRFWNW